MEEYKGLTAQQVCDGIKKKTFNLDTNKINEMIDNGMTKELRTIIYYFCECGAEKNYLKIEDFKLIMENVRDWDIDYILEGFCDSNRIDILEFLINNYDVNISNIDPILISVFSDRFGNIELLMTNNYDINNEQCKKKLMKQIADSERCQKLLKYFLDNGLIMEKQYIKYFVTEPENIKTLIQYGISPEDIMDTLIEHLKKEKISDALQILFDNNVNINEYIMKMIKN